MERFQLGQREWGHRLVLRRVLDPAPVFAIWSNPSIHPFVIDDFSDIAPLPIIVANPTAICLMPESADAYFIFIPQRFTIWEVHAAVLRSARQNSVAWGREAAAWMRQHTTCRCILSYVPRGNYAAMALDRAIGFRRIGIVPKCHQHKSVLRDMSLMALEV